MCCMCDPFLTSVRLRCFQEMYKKMELQTFTVYRWYPGIQFFLFHFSLLTFHLGDWWDYTYTKKAPLVFSSPCLALGWLNTLALVWHPATVANHYETHNKR